MILGQTVTAVINDQPQDGLSSKMLASLNRLVDRIANAALNSAAIAIGTTTTKVKTTATLVFRSAGIFKSLAATDDFWTLSGTTIADGYKNKYLLLVSGAGAASVQEGVQALTAAAVEFTDAQLANIVGKTVVGVLTVATAGATFVPGTTALSAGTVTDTYEDGFPLPAVMITPHV